MVLDTSAIIAILFGEPEQQQFIDKIQSASSRLLSAVSFVESSIVLVRELDWNGIEDLDQLIRKAEIDVVSVDREQALAARQAYRRFGKGPHPAGLNFGDCFAYALSQTSGEPLLFKGNDFHHTDVAAA